MLQINDRLRIRKNDERNLIIEEYNMNILDQKTKEVRSGWQWVGYYGTLQDALIGILNKQLFDSVEEELTLKDIITKINKVENEIQDIKKNKIKEIK